MNRESTDAGTAESELLPGDSVSTGMEVPLNRVEVGGDEREEILAGMPALRDERAHADRQDEPSDDSVEALLTRIDSAIAAQATSTSSTPAKFDAGGGQHAGNNDMFGTDYWEAVDGAQEPDGGDNELDAHTNVASGELVLASAENQRYSVVTDEEQDNVPHEPDALYLSYRLGVPELDTVAINPLDTSIEDNLLAAKYGRSPQDQQSCRESFRATEEHYQNTLRAFSAGSISQEQLFDAQRPYIWTINVLLFNRWDAS